MSLRTMLRRNAVGMMVGLCSLYVPAGLEAQEPPPDPGRRAMARFGQTPSERDVDEASLFMQQHAPNRWQLIQGLPDEGAFRRGVIAFMVARHKSLQSLQNDDPELYKIKLMQLKSEDDVYGLIGSSKTPEQREAMRSELSSAVGKMVELNIAEREHRIKKLRASLAAEEQRLENDRKQTDRAVKSRVDTLIADGPAAMRRELLSGGRGGMRREGPATQPTRRERDARPPGGP